MTRSDALSLVRVLAEHVRVATASLRGYADCRMRADACNSDVLAGLICLQNSIVVRAVPVERIAAPYQWRAGW